MYIKVCWHLQNLSLSWDSIKKSGFSPVSSSMWTGALEFDQLQESFGQVFDQDLALMLILYLHHVNKVSFYFVLRLLAWLDGGLLMFSKYIFLKCTLKEGFSECGTCFMWSLICRHITSMLDPITSFCQLNLVLN